MRVIRVATLICIWQPSLITSGLNWFRTGLNFDESLLVKSARELTSVLNSLWFALCCTSHNVMKLWWIFWVFHEISIIHSIPTPVLRQGTPKRATPIRKHWWIHWGVQEGMHLPIPSRGGTLVAAWGKVKNLAKWQILLVKLFYVRTVNWLWN